MKDNKLNEILNKYTGTEESAKEVNAELKKNGYVLQLDPKKNKITIDEIINGTHGLLYTGTGYPDKVEVVNGELKYAVNQVNPDGTTNMTAFVEYQGKRYEVFGKKLIECK